MPNFRVKRFIIIISVLAAIIMPRILPFAASASLKSEKENDIELSDWAFKDERLPQIIYDGENARSVTFSLPSNGKAEYKREISSGNFMADFDLSSGDDFDGETVRIIVGGGEDVFYSFDIILSSQSYNVILSAGAHNYELRNVAYGEDGRVQLRLAFEEVIDFETYSKHRTWNFVAGSNKMTNKNANRFVSSDFEEISDALMSPQSATVSVVNASESEIEFTFRQISFFCFYDYEIFEAPGVLNEAEDIYYNRISITWTLPDISSHPRGGFKVERVRDGAVEEILMFDNAYVSSITDRKLKQNTSYTYRVTAFEEVDAVTSKVACERVTFKYKDVTVTTLKGNPTTFIIVSIISIILIAGIILIYIKFYDIKSLINKKMKMG